MHSKCPWSSNGVGSSRSAFFINFFHMGAIFCFFPAILMPHFPIRIILVFDEKTGIPHSALFPIQVALKRPGIVFLTRDSKWMSQKKIGSRGTTGSSMSDQGLGHFCLGRRIHISGHSDFGTSEQIWSILHLYLSVC